MAYHVCSNSALRHASKPLAITPLALHNLSAYNETHQDGSNQFIYSRFLIPELMAYQGWALFIDGDMILREDVSELWDLRDESKAVMCVKHDYQTRAATKYLGARNDNYPRKIGLVSCCGIVLILLTAHLRVNLYKRRLVRSCIALRG